LENLNGKNGSKMMKAERDVVTSRYPLPRIFTEVDSCLNTWQAIRDLEGPECPSYVWQVPSQIVKERINKLKPT